MNAHTDDDESTSSGGEPEDIVAAQSAMNDADVQALLKEFGDQGLLPVRRNNRF